MFGDRGEEAGPRWFGQVKMEETKETKTVFVRNEAKGPKKRFMDMIKRGKAEENTDKWSQIKTTNSWYGNPRRTDRGIWNFKLFT